jgi:serine/threonine protein kinase
MNPERWQKIETLFETALAHAPDARAAYLSQTCDGDQALRAEVESLIESHEKANLFFRSPVFKDGLKVFIDGAKDAMAGARIGPYKIIREIGRGGMGTVFLASRADEQYESRVAIKLIKRGMDTDEILSRFRKERQILANLAHPNIARLLDGGMTSESLPYFVMEYIEGRPIDEYCEERCLSIEERLRLFLSACSAVSYAHQHLVIHRDLKPINIIVTREGVPKLLDFGIAKVLRASPHQTTEVTARMMRVMTPEYASPEQIRGERITTATDIYSLGVILYELLTGHRPSRLKDHGHSKAAGAVREEEPLKPSIAVNRFNVLARRRDSTPSLTNTPEEFLGATRDSHVEKPRSRLRGDLDNIVRMAMRKDSQRRYSSVEQFSEDIRRYLEGLPVIARKDTFSYRAAKFIKRHRVGVAAACLIFLTLLGGIIATTWQARKAREQARIANAKSEEAQKALAKAAKINTFLQSVFSYANPQWFGRAGGKQDMSAMELMRDIEKRIDTEFATDPEVRADLHQQIGDTYRTQRLLIDAERNLREALRLRLELYGEDNAKVAETLYILSGVRFLQGDIKEHERLLTQALGIQRRHPDDGNNLPYMMVDYAALLANYRGDYQRALALELEALSLFRQRYGDDHYMVAATQALLHDLYLGLGDYRQAETYLQGALNRPQDGYLTLRLLELAELQIIKGDYQAAENLIKQALTQQSNEEATAVFTMRLYATQSFLAQYQSDYARAKTYREKALALAAKNSPFYYRCVISLAQSLNKLGQPSRAEPLTREAIEALQKSPYAENEIVQALFDDTLGESLAEQRRFAEAETLLLAAYQTEKARLLPQQVDFTATRQHLAILYRAWGKADEAKRYE